MHESKARYRVSAWGRQSGKSTWANNEMAAKAWNNPNTKYWFMSPTYDQAKNQYRRLTRALFNCDVFEKNNQTENRIRFINGSEIIFKSGESLDNLRGETLNGAIIDEVRDQHAELWPMVIRPMLSTTSGWAAFISTPNGFDQFYDLFEMASKDTSNTWNSFQAPSTCNPLFTKEEFERLKSEMSEAQFAQEILAEFRDLTAGKAYISFTNENIVTDNPFAPGQYLSPYLPITVGLDFNISPMSWTMGQERSNDWYWFDEVWLENSHTQEASKELVARLIKLKDMGYLKTSPNVIICGDATGKASQRAAAGQSDYDILFNALRVAGITFTDRTPSSNPPVKDRVNTVNNRCRDAAGNIHMWVHQRCVRLIRDMQRVLWKLNQEATLDQTKDKTLTHSSDSIGYPIHATSPIQRAGGVGTLRVITR